jgi:hypothetical protein
LIEETHAEHARAPATAGRAVLGRFMAALNACDERGLLTSM